MTQPTTPTRIPSHGSFLPRGLEITPSSTSFAGRFGRMFRNLPVYEIEDASLVALGESMIQPLEDGELDKPLGEEDDDENTAQLNGQLRLPAGYTYFGQFVDHDITFDPVSSLSRQNDPDALTDFRTPRFDLDSLYGRGPSDQPYMYDPDGVHLTLGSRTSDAPVTGGPDLPRVAATGRAIIGDPRNDENLIVSQLQVAMLRFHNANVDRVRAASPNLTSNDVFKTAQQLTRWHYQWIVIHDFLPRLVGDDVVDDILKPAPYATSPSVSIDLTKPNLRFYRWKNQPFMPLEFSVAAYRFGHSMIRPSYLINDVARTDPPVTNAKRIPVFSQTGSERQSLNGFRRLPADWAVDWKFFLPDVHGLSTANLPQPSYKLDATLSHPLGALPASTAGPELVAAGFDPSIAQSLAVRNLLRSKRLSLPSGQDVARAMGVTPLTEEQLFGGSTLAADVRNDLDGRAPLWFYILKEAEILGESAQLGPVGGRIVAEVLIGLLVGDPLSYLNVDPNWTPTLPSATADQFSLTDLVNIAIPSPGGFVPPVYDL